MIKQQLQEALSILEAYEQLEADLIMCDEVWATSSGLPQSPGDSMGDSSSYMDGEMMCWVDSRPARIIAIQ